MIITIMNRQFRSLRELLFRGKANIIMIIMIIMRK
jgi:hypothetical protein